MYLALAGIGLGTGILAAVLSLVVPQALGRVPGREKRPRVMPGILLGAALTAVAFFLTCPKEPPWSSGQRLGWGLLIGGVSALLAALGAARLPRGEKHWPFTGGVVLGLALAAVSLTVLLFRGDPGDAVLGCALGIVMVAGVFRALGAGADSAGDFGTAMEAGAGLATTLAAGCVVAIYHFDQANQRGWWAYGLALAGFWLLGHLISYAAAAPRPLARYPMALLATAAALAVILILALGGPLGGRLEPSEKVGLLLLSALVTGALILWLALASARENGTFASELQAGGLAAALVLFLLLTAFKGLASVGMAVALTAMWGVGAAALGAGGRAARIPVQALALGASFLLLRLFLARSGISPHEGDMAMHYTLVGLVLGAAFPFVFSSLRPQPGVGRAMLLLVLGVLTPLAILALWGTDAVLGLAAGLVAAQALIVILPRGRQEDTWLAPTGLLALGAALVAVQFSRPSSFLYEMPRVYKVYVAGGIALIVVLWIVAVGLLRLRARLRAPAAPASQEG